MSLGKKPKQIQWLVSYILIILGMFMLGDMIINYAIIWYDRIVAVDFSEYYQFMDRCDNAVINFWEGK